MRKKILFISVAIFIVFMVLAYKPISFSENPKSFTGKVLSVHEGGINDAVFKLENDKNTFYINRGFEDFETAELQSLIDKTVIMHCSEGWTPLDPFNNRSKNIEKLEVNNSVFFPK